MTERTRAQKRLTRALAWHQVLLGREEQWLIVWSAQQPEKKEILAIIREAQADALEEITIARRECEIESR